MNISTTGSTATLEGTIKSISDFQDIKNKIDTLTQTYSSITIKIPTSISMTSAVIGYLTKLKLKNSIAISMYVGDKRLYQLLEDLHLTQLFNVVIQK